MAILKPFNGVRPNTDLADKVASLPYDVMNREEAKKLSENNPYSFLHITRSEIDLDESVDPYSTQVYEKAKTNLDNMIKKGIFVQDSKPYFYIYRQIMNGRAQTGIVGCTSVDDYINDTIKKHEFTRFEKELDRINHFDHCDANTEPVFITYRANNKINNIINEWTQNNEPIYNFVSDDSISHIVWVIDSSDYIQKLKTLFASIDYLYIADGHHRSASAAKVGLKRRESDPNFTGDEEYNYFLSVLFSDDELLIMDYNRVVSDLNNLTSKEFIDQVSKDFLVGKSDSPVKPNSKHTFGMYLENQWYKLTAKENIYEGKDPVNSLDVSILQNNLLSPILGIKDPRKDKRIDFIGGIRGLDELKKRGDSDMKVAFSLFPPSMDDLFSIADMGEVMPPKSTWFEPKLRSGLFIHKF